ncbi:MAG: hypothetical protein KME16_22800 [Scytolyngbya sp. HA4215-MV1]|nr:hypothetical protein [Scytolyngbya sp. HA4215-MV1]
MHVAQSRFKRSDYLSRKADYQNWHRRQSKQHILRSQLGFNDPAPSRPKPCQGCMHYHGSSYGHNRIILICGFHPYGWQGGKICPDWAAGE